MIGYEIFTPMIIQKKGIIEIIVEYFVLYAIGYGLVYSFGMLSEKMKRSEKAFLGIAFLLIHMILRFVNNFQPIQQAKYPPQLYYYSYGLSICFLLISIPNSILTEKLKNNRVVRWIAANTLMIYYWHIIFLRITAHINVWSLRYCVVLVCAMASKYLQSVLLGFLRKKKVSS